MPPTLETVVIAQCGCKISTHLPETDISCGFSNFPGDCIDFVVDWFLWKTFISFQNKTFEPNRTKSCCLLLLQDLLQSCALEGRRIVEDIRYGI